MPFLCCGSDENTAPKKKAADAPIATTTTKVAPASTPPAAEVEATTPPANPAPHTATAQPQGDMQSAMHFVLKTPIRGPYPDVMKTIYFGSGCFWGSEEVMWKTPGVYTTAVGYQGGKTDNPRYSDICRGNTNHAETVKVVYDPSKVALVDLLRAFWQSHDPTQGDGQGNDRGTQYRSAIYCENDAEYEIAQASKVAYEKTLRAKGYGPITTEIAKKRTFHYAEDNHQQFLAKPGNRQYCSAQPTGIALPLASEWLPPQYAAEYGSKVSPDDIPASRCARGKCSI